MSSAFSKTVNRKGILLGLVGFVILVLAVCLYFINSASFEQQSKKLVHGYLKAVQNKDTERAKSMIDEFVDDLRDVNKFKFKEALDYQVVDKTNVINEELYRFYKDNNSSTVKYYDNFEQFYQSETDKIKEMAKINPNFKVIRDEENEFVYTNGKPYEEIAIVFEVGFLEGVGDIVYRDVYFNVDDKDGLKITLIY